MKPTPIKALTINDVIARAKAKAIEYDKLSDEEKKKRDEETRKILQKLGPGLVAINVKP